MGENTRDQLLESAKYLFASKGFYGASLANIADNLGLSKQALLHHFGSKEKLYAKILQQISERMLHLLERSSDAHRRPAEQLENALLGMYEHMLDHPYDARILMRELLDVERRADEVHSWYLKPFLDTLTAIVRNIPAEGELSAKQALTRIYPVLGGLSYFAVSGVVLEQLYGATTCRYMEKHLPEQLRQQIRYLIDQFD